MYRKRITTHILAHIAQSPFLRLTDTLIHSQAPLFKLAAGREKPEGRRQTKNLKSSRTSRSGGQFWSCWAPSAGTPPHAPLHLWLTPLPPPHRNQAPPAPHASTSLPRPPSVPGGQGQRREAGANAETIRFSVSQAWLPSPALVLVCRNFTQAMPLPQTAGASARQGADGYHPPRAAPAAHPQGSRAGGRRHRPHRPTPPPAPPPARAPAPRAARRRWPAGALEPRLPWASRWGGRYALSPVTLHSPKGHPPTILGRGMRWGRGWFSEGTPLHQPCWRGLTPAACSSLNLEWRQVFCVSCPRFRA